MSLPSHLQPVNWTAVEDSIFDWMRIVSGLKDESIRWEQQDLAQPDYPYVSLLISSVIKEATSGPDETRSSTDLTQANGQEVELMTVGSREFTLTVQAWADERSGANDSRRDPMFLATKLRSSLGQRTTVDRLKAAGISLIEEGAVNNTSITVNDIWIQRFTFDVRMRVVAEMTERIGFIDEIQGTGTINPGPNQVTVDIGVDVGTP